MEGKITGLMTPDQRERLLSDLRQRDVHLADCTPFDERPRLKESGIPEDLFETVGYK